MLWLTWGAVLGALVLVIDRDPAQAGVWWAGAAGIAFFGLKVLRPSADPFLEWYVPRDGQLWNRLLTLVLEKQTQTEEYERCAEEHRFAASLALPPLCGLFHGSLLGGIVGTLCGLSDEVGVHASTGAALGILVGPVLVSGTVAIMLTFMVQIDRRLPWRARCARRLLMLVSPVLIVPAAWHCVKRLVQRNGVRG